MRLRRCITRERADRVIYAAADNEWDELREHCRLYDRVSRGKIKWVGPLALAVGRFVSVHNITCANFSLKFYNFINARVL